MPAADIDIRTGSGEAAVVDDADARSTRRGPGLLEWLFGVGAPEADARQYRAHIEERGGAALSVRIDDQHHDRIAEALEDTNLIGFEDAPGAPAAGASGDTVMPTAKEELDVGKRRVSDVKHFRIRRYVVERPAEANVALHDETVVVERRAPASAAPGAEPFEEREIEVTESREEPVVSKRVVPGEEVVVRKEGKERVETVRGKLRESRVEIDKAAAGDKPSAAGATTPRKPPSSRSR
ncbi:MAG TPA: YsnF/AvaK domain-containing protein [Roseiarcus sp.]|nr:YsnF/AvaK domain-containing protein [Roseiarcus sp.]